MSIITLTTDYGLKDHFVGSLKGKILSDYEEAVIVDISHHIDAFNTAEASYILGASYACFPKGTVHLIGVDIELNKENQHIAMQWNDHYFICADNGILSMLIEKIVPEKIVAINIHDRLLPDASDMDVFIKVAVHLAKGGLLNVIGKEIKAIKEVTELKPILSDDKNTLKGYVIYIDHYGNAVTNISKQLFVEVAKGRPYEIILNEKFKYAKKNTLKTILAKYSDIANAGNYDIKNYEGDKLALFNEAGFLEIAIFRSNPATVGSAATLMGIGYRDVISIEFGS